MIELDFPEKILCLKIGKMDQKWAKNSFINLLKKFVINFYIICCIMKIHIICCVPAPIPCLGKISVLRYRPKCSQPMRSLGESGQK